MRRVDALDRRAALTVGLGLLAVWLALSVALGTLLVPLKGRAFDFYPRWHGARALLIEGRTPYGPAVGAEILAQMGFTEYIPYRLHFNDVAPLVALLLPFWGLPWGVAVSLWTGLALLLLLLLPLIVWGGLGWRVPTLVLAAVTLGAVFVWRHAVNVVLLGQLVPLALAAIVGAWALEHAGRPVLAGVLLLYGVARPEGIVFSAALLLGWLIGRRWRALAAWGTGMAVLFAWSLVAVGWWVPAYLDTARGYRACCVFTSPPDLLGGGLPSALYVAAAVLWGAWMLAGLRHAAEPARTPFALAVVMLVYLLAGPQSKDYTLLYVLLPLLLGVWAWRGRAWVVLAALLVWASPWGFRALGWTLESGWPLEQVLTPLACAVLLTVAAGRVPGWSRLPYRRQRG